MLTRRGFLLGAGAVVVAGAAGVEVVGRDRVLHKLGLEHSPDHQVPASGWRVQRGTLDSAAMRRTVPWAVAAPPSGSVDGVIVCLHGHGNDELFAFDAVHLHDVVAAAGARWAVAATTGGPGTYWHRRRNGTDAGALVSEELVPFLQRRLHVDRVALLGWSMGGYGSILLAERHPDRFPVVAAASPALWERAADTAPGAFDDAADYAAHDVFGGAAALRASRVRVDCGSSDPFLAADRAFAARAGATTSFTAGYHDAAYWRSIAPAQVRFITVS